MKKFLPRRAANALILFALLALLVASSLFVSSARTGARHRLSVAEQRLNQARLKSELTSSRSSEFLKALDALAALDEPGALDLWRVALQSTSPELKKVAWDKYRKVQAQLVRNETVPQVARVQSVSSEINRIAREAGLDTNIWSENGSESIIAAPPYLIEQIGRAGIPVSVMFDSISEWQRARARGDVEAISITPGYQADADKSLQVRIAVIDLVVKREREPGYSDWLGDGENILMRSDSFIAYLDIFQSDGSEQSINAHIREQYTKRGYKVAGFYTTEQFAVTIERYFPGKSFNAGQPKSARSGQMSLALEDGRFHSYDETLAEFKALASAHPDIASYVKIGNSYEGREIFALKITRNAAVDDSNKPDVLITGCHHAREWISVEPPVYYANLLINGYDTDGFIKSLVDHLEIWIVPIVNPDGLTFSQSARNESFDPARMWRKNRRPISISNCASGTGVDLNRNYDFQWRLRGDEPCSDYCESGKTCINDDAGASDDPGNPETYRGPRADSEPEVKAIKSLLDDPNRNFRAHIDYHNYSQLILYPWGYQRPGAPDSTTLSRLAEQMSDQIQKVNNRFYRPQQAYDLYVTTGTSTDYAYGVSNVAVPLVIEMRPTCCEFSIPEGDIDGINRENWAGARVILNWAVGPPVLESVKAYSIGTDGTFSKLVYSARWVDPTDPLSTTRQMVVETQFPGIEQGRLQFRLQFSKSMNTALDPRVTLGRESQLDELRVASVGDQGWQKTVYDNDTWVGETVLIQDENKTSAWRLAVAATDASGFNLDGNPETIASYATGTGNWKAYEDLNNEGTIGGTDAVHVLSPTIQGDLPNVLVASPIGGERLIGGETLDVTWTVPKQPQSAVIDQAVLITLDGGATYQRLAESIQGNIEKYQITLPKSPTTRARIRIVSALNAFGNILFGDNKADFTIGTNVGGEVDMTFVSSEKVDGDWTDTPSDGTGEVSSGPFRFVVNVKITNKGAITIANPFIRIGDVTRQHVLLSRDSKSLPIIGARQTIEAGNDNVLSPGETIQVRLVLGLISKKKFSLGLELFGVPVGGQAIQSSPFYVWQGKPKTK